MRRQRRGPKLLAIILGLALVAAACGGDDDDDEAGGTDDTAEQPEGPTGGTLTDLQNFAQGEPDHIDPQLASTFQGAQIPVLLYDGLTEFDYSGDTPELMPQVAESWDTEDGQTWTFQIKEGQVFSDGTDVLPSSFVRGIERALSPDMASEISYHALPIQGAEEFLAGDADEVAGLTADDEAMTLTMELTAPLYDWPAILSHPVFSPIPEAADELDDQTQWEQGVMIGNGPFAMAEPWQHEEQISLVRNDEWNGGIYGEGTQARLDGVDFVISSDVDSSYSDFEAGNGDTALIPPGRFQEAIDNYPHATDPNMAAYFFGVNLESQLGGDENLKLRQALSLAIDRDAINERVYDGARRNATGITPPEVPGYEDGLCEFCEYDPEQAEQLVNEWEDEGGQLDHPIRINFNVDSGHEDVVAIVQQNLQDIGLEAELDGRDPTNYFAEMRQGDCEFCRLGWIWDYPVYDSPIFAEFHSDSIDGDNIARLNDPEVDEAIDTARATEDEDERLEHYREAERLALEQVAAVPVNWYTGQVVYTDDVDNVIMTPIQFILYEQVTLAS